MIAALLFLAGATSFLIAMHLRRRKLKLEEASLREWVHHGFDTAEISPRLNQVRNAHASIVHARQMDFSYQASLLAQARRCVRALAFFKRNAADSEIH